MITESQFKEPLPPKQVEFTNPAEDSNKWHDVEIAEPEHIAEEIVPTPEVHDVTEEPIAAGYDDTEEKKVDPREFVGLLDNTYLMFYNEDDKSLEITDQHAAHERVLYERILRQSASNQTLSQPLLIPQMIELSRPEAGWLEKMRSC